MTLLDELRGLISAGKEQDAELALRRAAGTGDAETLFAVANWRLFGLHGPRDLAQAHRLLEQSADCGHIEAVRLRATLIGNGTGCPSDPDTAAGILAGIRARDAYAELQLGFAEKMRPDAEIGALPVERLSESPSIRAVRGFLSPEECGYVITLASPHLQPSFVIDPQSGRRIPHPVRTSSGMSFGPTQEDHVIHKINRRIARVTRTRVSWGEPLHILSYAPGQEYRPHVDSLPGVTNQRHWTVLIYLNAGYSGGETRFDAAGVQFAGHAGDALIFRNVDEEGRPDLASRHAGLPVTTGTKWLATRWIRQRDYHPWAAA
jgi:prolyl 4-hydroxylase